MCVCVCVILHVVRWCSVFIVGFPSAQFERFVCCSHIGV